MFEFSAKEYPTRPGCYLMKDRHGAIIYVGKAKNLRRRLSSYFQKRHKHPKTRRLVRLIAAIEIMLVNNETESLLLENNLIKFHQPPFNRMLKAKGSGYSYIALTDEAVPRFVPHNLRRRNRYNPAPTYAIRQQFGPFASRRFRDAVLAFVNDQYKLRTCEPLPHEICLRYHMHKCTGICEKRIPAAAYQADIDAAIAFFTHQHIEMIRRVKREMMLCAEQLQFERAQWLKEQLLTLEQALEEQIVERDEPHDQDVIYFGEAHALIMSIAKGTLRQMHMKAVGQVDEQAFLRACYAEDAPPELIVNLPAGKDALAADLSAHHGYKIRVSVPQRGIKRRLLELCALNFAYRREGVQGVDT